MLSASTWTTRSVATIWRRPPGWVRMFVWMRVRSSSYSPHTKWYVGPGGFIYSTSWCKKNFTQQSNWLPQRRLFAVKTRSCVIGCFLCSLQSPWLTGWTSISPMFQHLLLMWAEQASGLHGLSVTFGMQDVFDQLPDFNRKQESAFLCSSFCTAHFKNQSPQPHSFIFFTGVVQDKPKLNQKPPCMVHHLCSSLSTSTLFAICLAFPKVIWVWYRHFIARQLLHKTELNLIERQDGSKSLQ